VLIPLGVLATLLAVAGGAAAAWAINIYNSTPPLSSLQAVQKDIDALKRQARN